MLDELGPLLPKSKVADLLSRLDHVDTSNALSAEAELTLMWALRQVSHVVIEPTLPGTKSCIDAVAHHLLPSRSAAVEITAISDDAFSGREDMMRTANIVCARADQIRKKASQHLHFAFGSGHVRDGRRSKRARFVDPNYKISPEHDEILRAWLSAPDWPNPKNIVLRDEKTAVSVVWQDRVYPETRVFCSMPPVAYDLKDNPLYKALRDKERQMDGIPSLFARCIFVADAGCNLLWSSPRYGGPEKSADEIVRKFLARDTCKTDLVCLFSPRRPQSTFLGHSEKPKWSVSLFDRRQVAPTNEYDHIQWLASIMPPPSLEGYQARQRHRQGSFAPQGRGRYLGTTLHGHPRSSHMTIELSARLMHELLAGRISVEQFHQRAFGRQDFNNFEYELAHGRTIRNVRIVPQGVEHDDDIIAFDLADDVSAALFREPAPPKLRQRFDAWVGRLMLGLRLAEAKSRDDLAAAMARAKARTGGRTSAE